MPFPIRENLTFLKTDFNFQNKPQLIEFVAKVLPIVHPPDVVSNWRSQQDRIYKFLGGVAEKYGKKLGLREKDRDPAKNIEWSRATYGQKEILQKLIKMSTEERIHFFTLYLLQARGR